MSNHFHLAIRVGQSTLSTLMQRILTAHAISFNQRHGRQGHLFQARYKAVLCLRDSQLHHLIRYIHANPVRARLVSHPKHWPWSSYNTLNAHTDDAFEWGVMDGFDPWAEERVQPKLVRQNPLERPELDRIAISASRSTDVRVEQLWGEMEARRVTQGRRIFAALAMNAGYKISDIARWLNRSPASVSRYLKRERKDANDAKPDT